jgi:hypothetical protein
MSAREFLDRLENDGLLEPAIIADLRRQVSEASRGVSAESLAKLLVDNGHLTRFQASKIVAEVTARIEQRKAEQAASAEARRVETEQKAAAAAKNKEEELLLGSLGDEAPPQDSPAPPKTKSSSPASARTAPQPTSAPSQSTDLVDDEDLEMLEPLEPIESRPPHETRETRANAPASASATSRAPAASSPPARPPAPRANVRPPPPKPAPEAELLEEADLLTPIEESRNQDPFGEVGQAPGGGRSSSRAVRKKKGRDNPWDSPLMLVGGGSLVLLLVAVYVLYSSMTRGTATEFFESAESDYRAGAYANAIDTYGKMIRRFPKDPNVGKARVKQQMAEFRMVAEGTSDPQRALDAAQTILPQIENEEEFEIVRGELATILPDIARGFADRARNAPDIETAEQLLASVAEAMELVNNPAYIPTTFRKAQVGVISQVEESVALVQRDINRERELAKAVEEMNEAVTSGDTRGAYRRRDELVAVYPGLERHPDVVRAINQVGERERDLVQVIQSEVSGIEDDPTTEGESLVVFTRSGEGIPNLGEETVVVLALGSVYGLDAERGQVLWRRFVGFDAELHPRRFGEDPQADVLVSHVANNELLRLRARTGELVWRTPIGQPFHPPVIWREQVFVGTEDGKVWNLDAQTGESRRQTNLQQTIQVSPGADTRTNYLYQVGETDNLYLISTNSMECRGVYYLGHRQGTILAPPVVSAGYLFLVINAGPDYSYLHVLELDGDGMITGPAQSPVRLPGHVVESPMVARRRMLVTTTVGAIHVLEVKPEETPPVTQDISPQSPTRQQPQRAYALVDQGRLWVADERLVRYDVQAAQAQLSRRWVEFNRDSFIAPLQRVGPAIVHVRRPERAPGVRVSAVDAETGKNVFWQTDLGVPSLSLVAGEGGGVTSLSALGSAVAATADKLRSGLAESSGERQGAGLVYDAVLPLKDGRHAIFSPAGRILFFDPKQPTRPMRQLRLNIPESQAATSPLVLQDGVLVPLLSGRISLLDLATGDHKVLPFHPELRAGSEVKWGAPAAIQPDQREFVIADDQQSLFRVGIVTTGRPHLDALETARLEDRLVTGLVAPDTLAMGVARRSDEDVLLGFRLPRLALEVTETLQGRVDWGPQVVGDQVLLSTDADGLLCYGPDGKQRWKSPLSHGAVSGVLEVDGDLILASVEGVVWRVSGADGTERGHHELDEPIGRGPVRADNYLWVAGPDGTLHRLPFLD